ncbi:hypothetical protein AB4Z49_18980, partial [Cupriavidus sp. M-11]
APMAVAPPPAPAAPRAQPAPVAPVAPIAPVSPPAPALAIQAPRFAQRSAQATPGETARARAQLAGALTMNVREDPQLAVERLMPEVPGADQASGAPLALRITAAAPGSPEIRAWVERLWQAVPAPRRPPLPYAVQADSTLPPETLRIERIADSAR